MSDLALRRNIRAVTDALPDNQWIKQAAIYAALPEPRPPKKYITVELTKMARAETMVRRGEPYHFEYRSGPLPVVDLRSLRKGKPQPKSSAMGFRELARLAETDPAAFANATANDGPGWKREGQQA